MRSKRFGLFGSVMVAAVVLAGCTTDDPAADSANPGNGTGSTAQPPSTAAAPAMDDATKAGCTAMDGAIKTALADVADSEKIGPPAGHSAVSAQYSAGAAQLYVHMLSVNAEVKAAAEKVTTAMTDLAEKWMANPKTKPSKAALTTAINDLKAACAAK